MANPFLFGEPAAAAPPSSNEPPNPFLMDPAAMQPPAAVANPFMASAAPMQQPQQGFYPAPMEANPFASFGNAAAPGLGFGAASAFGHHAQPPAVQPQPHEPHQQQFQGQFGQYTQVMAESTAQPEVTPSVPQVTNNNPFGDPAESLPSPPPVMAEEKPREKVEVPDPDPEPPLPPQPPKPVAQPEPVEETLPPPPALPLEPDEAVDEEEVGKMEKVAIVAEPEPPTPPPEEVEDSAETPVKEEGFSGIFKSDTDTSKDVNALSTEQPLAAAVSTSDIPKAASAPEPETPASTPSPVEEQAPANKVPGGLGAALFGTSDEPMEGSSNIEVGAPKAPQLSTGVAIFADMPSVPDYNSTGASLFGASEESAQGTTGT